MRVKERRVSGERCALLDPGFYHADKFFVNTEDENHMGEAFLCGLLAAVEYCRAKATPLPRGFTPLLSLAFTGCAG